MDKDTLLAYQPDYYKESKVMEQINTADASELTILNDKVNTEYNNMYPDTADLNTLSRFEKDNGLTILPNYEIAYRRSRIYSRMVGSDVFSVENMKNIASLYKSINTIIDLDLPNFKFSITLNSNTGTANNIIDFENIIEEIKPAYLQVNFNYISNKTYKLKTYTASTLVSTRRYQLTNNLNENTMLNSNLKQATIQTSTLKYELS